MPKLLSKELITSIAQLIGCSRCAIEKRLIKYNIPRRSVGRRTKGNYYIDCGDYYKIIPSNNNTYPNIYILVDKEDYKKVSRHTWLCREKDSKLIYAQSFIKRKTTMLHYFIIGKPPSGLVTDHINGNPLDNRKCNLHFVTQAYNAQKRRKKSDNNIKYKNLFWNKKYQKWGARIVFNGKNNYLGIYNTQEEANDAVLKWKRKNNHPDILIEKQVSN